jgi:hypothetical protein
VSSESDQTNQETDPGGGDTTVPYPTTPNEDPEREHRRTGEQSEPQEPSPQPIHPPLPGEPIHPDLPDKPLAPVPLGFLSLLVGSLLVSGCAAIGDIFKAGVWVGVLAVVGLGVLVVCALSFTRR